MVNLIKQRTQSKHGRRVLITLLVILLGLPVSLIVNVPKTFAHEMAVTTNTSAQSNPAIYQDKIVWQDYRNGNWDIYMYDLSTGKETQITSSPNNEWNPAIYGDKIVWRDFRNKHAELYMYDLSTGQETLITTYLGTTSNPKIYGDRIVWEYNNDIYLYDLSTGKQTQITSDSYLQSDPAIYEDKIVWEDYAGIYLYDVSMGTKTLISDLHSTRVHPRIYADKIVWKDNRTGNLDIYMYSLSTGSTTQITSNSSEQWDPEINGDKIVWRDHRNGNADIYMYNLSTATETQITSNSSSQSNPAIYGDKIVWQDNRNGNADIYMYALASDNEGPVTTHSLTPSLPNSNGWYKSNVSISLSATDNESGVSKTEYRINGGAWTSYSEPFVLSNEGTNTVEYRSTDQAGNIEQTKSIQVKIDKTAPVLNVQLNRTILRPANHRLFPIRAQVSVSDATSGSVSWALTSIISNQPDTSSDPLDQANDIQGAQLNTADTTFYLRAESWKGRGRVYIITYTATDLAGNKTRTTQKVFVPPY
ncbi:TolB family protein [Lihuaxuella thermophila]|uniref:Beta propeller repeat-containing protein n=1 Tax=Lihuaxuella thermophila TaxID=1173111 RepID=A0A1H8IP37_9BACL|nr:DPP IV N-terminal domain-containing protein [Lihuaxuella thermophila]SEN69737.1 beta propeller repeat-containing protein [Lihuaxuella thermophila]